jgi:hypothetical protein
MLSFFIAPKIHRVKRLCQIKFSFWHESSYPIMNFHETRVIPHTTIVHTPRELMPFHTLVRIAHSWIPLSTSEAQRGKAVRFKQTELLINKAMCLLDNRRTNARHNFSYSHVADYGYRFFI